MSLFVLLSLARNLLSTKLSEVAVHFDKTLLLYQLIQLIVFKLFADFFPFWE
ncbi:MAG: hypothetical protein L3J84_00415 [Gammaproteobacteria bacterium]|nr:hypothetical protein [Gammaproteobacteria bacterium]